MSHTVCGIDVGAFSIKFAFLEVGFRKNTLRGVMETAVPAGETPLLERQMIAVREGLSQLSGEVRNARGDIDTAPTIILVPADFRSLAESGGGSRRLRTTRTNADGRYAFGGLLPGEYLVGAFIDNISNEITDLSRLFDTIARTATRVTIGEGDRRMQDLTSR